MNKHIFLGLLIGAGLFSVLGGPTPAGAFQYASLPSDNLILNAWFRNTDDNSCDSFSGAHWVLNSGNAPWGPSDKTQDPTDKNCLGNYTGYAARFARNSGAAIEFYPNQNAILYQIVQSPNPTHRTLHFHSLIVGHKVNQYKAEIYGGNSANGPWTSVWVPFDITCLDMTDCVNEKYGWASNHGDRTGLWDDVTDDPEVLGSLNPIQKTISQGYNFYKVEFLMNYPTPNGSATGDVGGKLARVYFRVSGGGGGVTPEPTPTISTLMQLLLNWMNSTFDQNRDGEVNSLDFGLLLQ